VLASTDALTVLEFRILGPLEVRRDGAAVAIRAPRQRALLGYLLLHANEEVPADELIEQLWGEEAPPTVRASLHNHVHTLRKIVGPKRLVLLPGGYVLSVERGELDLERFERLAAEARQAEPHERAAKLRAALACWRGPPLVEFPTEPFAQYEIHRLEEERLLAVEDRIDADLELGRHVKLVGELESLVDLSPLRERLWAQLMLALYRAGRQAEALAAYRRAHDHFLGELGLEPGVVLRELQRAILVGDAALEDPAGLLGSALERAAAILPRTPRERAEALYEFGVSLVRLGEQRQAVATLAAAERMAAATGERSVEERARLYRSYLSVWTEGKSPIAHLIDAERASAGFERRGDLTGLAVALRQRAQLLAWSGRAAEGAKLASSAMGLAARTNDPALEASCRGVLPGLYASGPMPVSKAIMRCEALRAEVPDEARFQVPALSALAQLYAEAGRIDIARQFGRKAIDAARASGLLLHLVGAMDSCGQAELTAGNLGAAVDHFREAYAMRETEEDHALLPALAAGLAAALAMRGDEDDEAKSLATAARAQTGPDAFDTEVLWRHALALIAARAGDHTAGLALAEEARRRTAASDWISFHGQTLEVLAAARQSAGDSAGATAALREALKLYKTKGNIARAQQVRQQLASPLKSCDGPIEEDTTRLRSPLA
jgi:DNA-binding SARP family transcriptional activator